MEPLYNWDSEGEWTLKALPNVVDWFERARGAAWNSQLVRDYEFDKRKLSAIYQFAQAMPVLFVPSSYTKVDVNNKRKRDDVQA